MGDRSIKPSTLSGGRAYARCMLHLSTLDANRIDEIEKGIAGLPGVLRTVVDYLQGAITVEYDPGLTSVEGIHAQDPDGPQLIPKRERRDRERRAIGQRFSISPEQD